MSSAMEFAITTDLTPLKEFNISANFEECQAWLEENLAPYRGMVVTEEGIGAAKKYRANIRSVAARIDECRKLAKAAALSSYTPFEEKCKALTALCAESADNLDGQIKAFDERRRTEKLEALRTFYDERIGELGEFLPWEAIFDKRWGNATFSEEQAHKDILVAISKCESSMASIRGLHSEFEPALLEEYKQSHDLSAVLQKEQTLRRIKELEEKRRAEQEAREKEAAIRRAAEQAAAEAKAKAAVEAARTIRTEAEVLYAQTDAVRQGIAAAEREEKSSVEAPVKEQPITLNFRVTGTAAQLNGLRDYMKTNGIAFGRVE